MRRHICLILLLLAMTLDPADAQQAHWPAFGGVSGNFKVRSLQQLASQPLKLAWQKEIGTGESGIVVAGDRVFATALLKQAAEFRDEDELFERVVCLDRTTGKVLWSKQYRVEKRDDQESFGASKRSPKATPAIVGDKLVTLGFTGQLKCWAIEDGSLLWTHDLVTDYGAKAVQFGYSGSPVPESDEAVLVLIGGEKAGLTCFDSARGNRNGSPPLITPATQRPCCVRLEEQNRLSLTVRTESSVSLAAVGDSFGNGHFPNPA